MDNSAGQAHPQAPLSQAPLPQAPLPQMPLPQAPFPQVPLPQTPLPQGPFLQGPFPQAPLPQAPFPQAPFHQDYPQPEGQSGYPVPQNFTVSSPQVFLTPTQQGFQPLWDQSAGGLYTSDFVPQPPRSISTTRRGPNRGWLGVPAQRAAASSADGTAGFQRHNHPVNSNGSFQYVQPSTSPWANSGPHFNAPIPFPQQPHAAHLTPQTTPPDHSTTLVIRSSSQNMGQNQDAPAGAGRNVPPAGPGSHRRPSPPYMPPNRVLAPRQGGGVGSAPQPQPTTSRYNLPVNTPSTIIRPQPVYNGVADPPAVSNRSVPGLPPTRPGLPTNLLATDTKGKRRADQPPSQQSAKRQKLDSESPAQQLPQPVTNASQVIPSLQEPSTPAQTDEPEHLPQHELDKIQTDFVIEPDPSEPVPQRKEKLEWSEAIRRLKAVLAGASFGRILVFFNHMEELCDAIELFIARPGRRPLLENELEELLRARYARELEMGILLCDYDRYTVRDWETASIEKMEEFLREARERKERERREQGPTLQEAQRDSAKWFSLPRPDM